ncbi:MAG: T9SS type A sorting domain-containing protein [Prevotella sp.]|nr:T9SS type A sorting domain-containing protein [Prevotella sp.]
MKRNLLVIPFVIAMLFTIPTISYAESAIEIIDNEYQEIMISVNASKLHVTGANGQTLYIYNVTGVCVMSMKIDSADRYYDLSLSRGCYIVKVGNTVRKISIK